MNPTNPTVSLPLLLVAGTAFSAGWDEPVKIFDERQVVIAYRTQLADDGWVIEWLTANGSNFAVEPILHSRTYTCTEGRQQTRNRESLGTVPAACGWTGLHDYRICTDSEIHTVTITREIAPAAHAPTSFGS